MPLTFSQAHRILMWMKIFALLFGLFMICGVQNRATAESLMNNAPFDFRSYGRLEQNEIHLSIALRKSGNDVVAALQFKNISQRDVNITCRLWFQSLELTLQGKKLPYRGPMVSMTSPKLSDFKTVKPGETYETEPVSLKTYFALPENATGELKAHYLFAAPINAADALLNL